MTKAGFRLFVLEFHARLFELHHAHLRGDHEIAVQIFNEQCNYFRGLIDPHFKPTDKEVD